MGLFWKFSRIGICYLFAITHNVGERLSPYVSIGCILMGIQILLR